MAPQEYPFIYTVEYWDEFEEKMRTESGITFGTTYVEAMERLTRNYEPGLNNILYFKGYDHDGIMPFPDGTIAHLTEQYAQKTIAEMLDDYTI